MKLISNKQTSLLGALISLTVLFFAAQISFFAIHYKVSSLLDSLAGTSIAQAFFHPIIIIPILQFFLLQLFAYSLLIAWVWFIAVSIGELYHFSKKSTYWFGLAIWLLACLTLLGLNNYYFSHSFFSLEMFHGAIFKVALNISVVVLLLLTGLAYWSLLRNKRHVFLGILFFTLAAANVTLSIHDRYFLFFPAQKHTHPNIIFIGLDSLRPDYVDPIHTPNIYYFLQTSANFTESYTPLARTYPSWVTILTGQHPLHHQARINMADSPTMLSNHTLTAQLKQQGYDTFYGTDEPRYTNIDQQNGFDHLIGPKGGAVEFILGGLTDLPLTNLLIKLPSARIFLPYNYGNRGADITYDPHHFLQQIKVSLQDHTDKPLFLALHLCLSHWPFTWAQDGQTSDEFISQQYQHAVEGIDVQFGQLLQHLKEEKLLDNSLVVVLSDHGVTLGMRHDRLTDNSTYHGNPKKLSLLTRYKLNSAPNDSLDFKHDFPIDTVYGQGTDLSGLNQNHVVMAFKGFGINIPAHTINQQVSFLMDITPTVLDYLHFSPLPQMDGLSLKSYLLSPHSEKILSRPLFMETGDKFAEIETANIQADKVVQKAAGLYRLDPKDGYLTIDPAVKQAIIQSKQHAVLLGDWLLARYPSETRYQTRIKHFHRDSPTKFTATLSLNQLKMAPYCLPAYFVLINLKTGQWTMDISPPHFENAPTTMLLTTLKNFYGNEI